MSQITSDFISHALRNGIMVKPRKGTCAENFAWAGSIELANLGFVVDPHELVHVSQKTIVETINEARKIMGAERDMAPIYPGFPKQVQELPTTTLLVEQILHYWSRGTLLPNYPTVAREGLPIKDMLRGARSLKVVPAVDAAKEFATSLVKDPIALSESHKVLLSHSLKLWKPCVDDISSIVKDSVNAENIQSMVRGLKDSGVVDEKTLALVVIGSTYSIPVILRTLLTLFTVTAGEKWDGNYDLAVNTLSDKHSRAIRMVNIPRPVRRVVLQKLGHLTQGYKADNVLARGDLWRKVMTSVHPYDFKLNLGQKRIIDILHGEVEYRTLNSVVEEAMETGDVVTAVEVMSEYQPNNLVRRIVSLLRLVNNHREAQFIASAVKNVGTKVPLSTLISAHNGVISANDTHARVNRVSGLSNTMLDRSGVEKINEDYVKSVKEALTEAITVSLRGKTAPASKVKIDSTVPVALVNRDAAIADQVMRRGAKFSIADSEDTIRVFGHWNNNMNESSYMDIAVVVLNSDLKNIATCDWSSWHIFRDWSTYSGDKLVSRGDSAAEYIDVNMSALKKHLPEAKFLAMTIQSWAGWNIADVDIIAGAMLRSDASSGEVFDARTVSTAFSPTAKSSQSVPLVIDLGNGEMTWIDSSNGAKESGVSSNYDSSVGAIVYDELVRSRMNYGELARLWAEAHGVETVNEPAEVDLLSSLL